MTVESYRPESAWTGNQETWESSLRETRSEETRSESNRFFTHEVQENASQETAWGAHEETKASMLREHGEVMSAEQRRMLESDETKGKIHVLSAESYLEQFPKADLNVVGHCDEYGNIYMKEISPNAVRHVTTHETMHLCAHREVNALTDGSSGREVISGLRRTEIRGNEISSINTSVNEGFTQMYTLRELRGRGEYAAAAEISSYEKSVEWAQRMEGLLGKETCADAYFGEGYETMVKEFNRLNGDETAWRSFSENMEVFNDREATPREQKLAELKIERQYLTMAKARMAERRN